MTVQHRSGYHTGDEDSKEQRGTNEEEVGVHCRVMATVGSLTEFVEEDGDLVDDIESLECFFLANDITDEGGPRGGSSSSIWLHQEDREIHITKMVAHEHIQRPQRITQINQ